MKKRAVMVVLVLAVMSGLNAFANELTAENVAPLLAELEIMVGDANGDLHLENLVSRAEFTKVAVASSSYKNTVALTLKTSSYKDVAATHWAAPYIKVGVDSGLCKGYSDSTFRPDNTVTYEEAITMMLRVLGYSESDFGNSWPYGPVGMAQNLGMTEGIDKNVGEALSRREVARLVYNTLNTKTKDTGARLLSIFDTQRVEDIVLISFDTDGNSWSDEVFTSSGTYKIYGAVSADDIGKHGDMFIKDSDKLLAFVPYGTALDPEKHIVYSLLGNDIITYKNKAMSTLTLSQNTVVYEDDTQSTYSLKSSQIEMGDILYVQKKNNNTIDYIIYEEGNIEGPFTVSSSSDVEKYPGAKILRNGEEVAASEVQNRDIAYYSPDLNMVMTYSNKVTGVYENAEPNKDAPTSVTVSGVSYKIESGTAFEKLSSNGSFKLGDTVTLLLGKNNEVADVAGDTGASSTVYGYLYETGTKEFTRSDLSKYTSFYIKVVTPDGQSCEYTANTDYKNYRNSVKRITFTNGVAKAYTVSSSYDLSGTLDWENKTLGSETLSSDLKIVDVSTVAVNDDAAYTSVFPTRLDGVKISGDNVLYVEKNNKNQICGLILKDVTGDAFSYGMISEAKSSDAGGSYSGYIDGNLRNLSAAGVSFSVYAGQAAKVSFDSSGMVQTMQPINKISSKITEITNSALTAGNKKYPLSDDVTVYKKEYGSYIVMPLSDIIENDEYTLTAYYDKSPEAGGRVRIIVAD